MTSTRASDELRRRLNAGLAIPACPLALSKRRRWDERRQRALFRYYLAAGAGGIAVGVHTTQFAIRDPKVGLFKPVLELAANTLQEIGGAKRATSTPIGVAGICGRTRQAVVEASVARELGYAAGLLSLGVMREVSDDALIKHCRIVAEEIPLFGFYLQPSVGGRALSAAFWRRFAEIENVVAIKIAPFNRYQTLDVVRAVVEAGREDIALYTGNDDNIVLDLLTPFRFGNQKSSRTRRIVGGLLGHWSVWTKKAVELHAECRALAESGKAIPAELLVLANQITDANSAIFDATNGYEGCIAGIHEVLRRQGLLAGTWCLDPKEALSPGQRKEIDRVCRAYSHLNDDEFVSQHLDEWLR